MYIILEYNDMVYILENNEISLTDTESENLKSEGKTYI